jgi:phage shock protein C
VNPRRLYRSRNDRILAGVAGGMAEYFGIDPTVVRLLWLLSIFFGGFSILVYIVLAFIVPLEPVGTPTLWGPPTGPAPAGAGYAAAPSQAPAAETGAAPAGSATGTGALAGATASAAGAGPAASPAGSTAYAAPTGGGYAGWAPPYQGWAPAPQPVAERRPGRTSLYVGIVLIVFGSFAAIAATVPGIGAGMLWPGLIVALGVALLVGAVRRDDPVPATATAPAARPAASTSHATVDVAPSEPSAADSEAADSPAADSPAADSPGGDA